MAALFYDRRGAVLPRRGMDMSSAFKEPAGDETLCSVFFAGKYAGAVLRSGKREFIPPTGTSAPLQASGWQPRR
jgi:hypothetical protein